APVIKYWPEFGQAGKEKILVRHILSHTSGVAGWDTKFTYKELVNWEKCVSLLETQKPWWEPGAKSGYHTISFGFLLGELVRRVTGKTIGTFFKEEVAEPLNADFHIGFSEEHDKRVSELIFKETSSWVILLARIFLKYVYKSGLNPRPNLAVANTRSWRGAEVPASNGHGNARSIVQIGSILACGGKINGTRFLSSSTVEDAIKEQIRGRDLVLGLAIPETRWALGFALCPINALSSYTDEELVGPRSFYWSGLGGSICIMDPDAKMCIAYAMNNLCNPLKKDKRVFRIVNALHSCLSD
ncbi:MAG: beta-lactamase family protein, partial [archaeon]|nr:beta-lactamase family protein [archaeon]